jgi:DNA-binding XRE family transcriptional regulator
VEQLVSKTNQTGRASVSGASEATWYRWPEDFPGTQEYLASEEAKAGLRELVLTHQIFQLRLVRKSLGITQVELAKRMGVSQIRISQIENGKLESFEFGTLLRYVEALGGTLSLRVKIAGKELELMSLEGETKVAETN